MSHEIDKLWDFYEAEESESLFRALLESSADRNEDFQFQVRTQIVRSLGLQAKFEEGHSVLDELEKEIFERNELSTVRYHLERGRLFNSAKETAKASKSFLIAFQSSKNTENDFYKVDAAHMLGIVEKGEEGLSWNVKAQELAQVSPNERTQGWQGSLLNNLGWSYHDRAEFSKSLEYFRSALSYRKKKGNKKSVLIALWCVARCLRSLNQIESALEKQLQLEAEYDAAEGDPSGYVFEEIGECLLQLGRAPEATPYFSKAFQILSKDLWLSKHETERLRRIKELSMNNDR